MCGHEHAPTAAPRLLCSVTPPGNNDDPLLRAWVSYCPPATPEDDVPAFITLTGHLDARTTTTIELVLDAFTEHVNHIVLNLFPVRHIDHNGVALLTRLHDRLFTRNGFLTIHDPSPAVQATLQHATAATEVPICTPGRLRCRASRSQHRPPP